MNQKPAGLINLGFINHWFPLIKAVYYKTLIFLVG